MSLAVMRGTVGLPARTGLSGQEARLDFTGDMGLMYRSLGYVERPIIYLGQYLSQDCGCSSVANCQESLA